jgi:Ser-tRNA(Ala) deacylase AlaX
MDSVATKLLYLTYEGNFQHTCEAVVLNCSFIEPPVDINNKKDNIVSQEKLSEDNIIQQWIEIILDMTVLHPQGGGQPTDKGVICNENTKVLIDRVVCLRETNVVKHIGTITQQAEDLSISAQSVFPLGSKVIVEVDLDRRNILSECHTAGHVVDAAMARCQQILPPLKGYHFLDGPYVEYAGNIPTEEREKVLPSLQAAFQVSFFVVYIHVFQYRQTHTFTPFKQNVVFDPLDEKNLIEEDIPTIIESLTKSQADLVCNRIQQNFDFTLYPTDEIRIVTVGGWPCPCGGTHVRSTGILKQKQWKILDFKCKKGIVRVRYGTSNPIG